MSTPFFRPFLLERYFAEHEFTVTHNLCASDAEPCTVAELLALAGTDAAALLSTGLGYSEPQGAPSLRAAIVKQMRRDDDKVPAEIAVDDIVVAAPQELVALTLEALCRHDGDQSPPRPVVVLTPCYQSLLDTPQQHGVPVRSWPVIERDDGFHLDMPALDALLDGAQGLVINLPHNPTGALCDAATFAKIIAACRARDVWLFSDEMYRGLEAPAVRLPVAATRFERAVSLTGLSKAYGLAGLRLGWVVVRDAAVRDEILTRKDFTTICAPTPTQVLAECALKAQDALFARHRTRIANNHERLEAFCAAHSETFSFRPAHGGPLTLVRTRAPSSQVAQKARAGGVLLLPSEVFEYGEHHVRIGLARKGFDTGLDALGAALFG